MTAVTPPAATAATTATTTTPNLMDEFFEKFYLKADSLDQEVRNLADQMDGDTEKIDELTAALTELRNNRPASSSGTGTISNATKEILKEHGIAFGGGSQDAFDTAIASTESALDQANSISQELVIELQQKTNQLTQVFELMSNFMSKFGTAVSNILGNIR